MDLIRRLIEAFSNWLRPSPRPIPTAYLSPPLQPNNHDDRFGYGINLGSEHEGNAQQRDGLQGDRRVQASEDSPAPHPQEEPAADIDWTVQPKEPEPCESSSSSETKEAASEPPSASSTSPAEAASPSASCKPSRKTRRAAASEYKRLEKARMKFDKWVTPKGTPAEKVQRAAPKPKPLETLEPEPESEPTLDASEVLPEDARLFIRDHYDDDPSLPLVLYEEGELWGQYNFRDTILDQLDRYWFYLARMKHHDADAYHFYRKYGAQMLPYMASQFFGKAPDENTRRFRRMKPDELEAYRAEIKLPPMFAQSRPGFGCVVYGANPKIESWEQDTKYYWPRFIYYVKMVKPPPETQLMLGGDTYRVTMWWDSPKHSRKWGTPQEFCIFISRDGHQIQVLRTCKTKWIPIKEKHSLRLFDIPDKHWRIPDDYARWARDFGLTPQDHLSHLFCQTLQEAEQAHYGDLRVQVHKDDMTAIFGIDSRRLSYFFKDRDYDDSGHRPRVFHIVKPHRRADGSYVKMHYRGEKEFSWAGYRVEITVPGLDHFLEEECDIGCTDGFWRKPKEKYITKPELADKLVNWMHQGKGSHRRAS